MAREAFAKLEEMRRSGLLAQIVRFGIAGGVSTIIYSAVYLPLTAWVLPRDHAVYCGFFLHSRWSFKGHGTRQPGMTQQLKFVGVQASGMALNALVTWIGTAGFGLAPWVPLVPAILLATMVTFVLNRYLVFA
jgi:putative flippase GtrA